MRAVRHASKSSCALRYVALPVVLAGCTSATRHDVEDVARPIEPPRIEQASSAEPDSSLAIPVAPGTAGAAAIPSPFDTSHPQVRRFVRRYQTTERRSVAESLARGSKYLPAIMAILVEEGVPREIAYLPIVESNFRVDAVSRAGAVGLWQLVRRTGRHYGLRIDGHVDERRDPEKSTRAAARYLRYLYDRFGDWHVSLAAYNTGEGRIARIRQRRGIHDFWEMSRRGYLPRETSRFVPRFLAAMEIASQPARYGPRHAPSTPPSYDWVTIDRSIPLRIVAQMTGSSVETLTELNPALRCAMVPPRGYRLRVPHGTRSTFEVAYARRPPAQPITVRRTHRVRRGEYPTSIARRYGVPVTALMQANCIGNPHRLQIGTRLAIPAQPPVEARAATTVMADAASPVRATRPME